MSRFFLLHPAFAILAIALAVGPASARDAFSLGLKVDELTAALIENRPSDIYLLFVPAFQAEVSPDHFESTFTRWRGERRLVKARSQVVGISGLGGHVSTYLVFAGDDDYRYVYQAWLNTDGNWRIAWLSGILSPGFQYGVRDTSQTVAVAEAALRFALSPDAPRRIRRDLVLPDTIVMLNDSLPLLLSEVDGRPVVLVTRDELAAGRTPVVPFVCAVPLVRIYGDLALATVDFRPGPESASRRLPGPRSLQVYLIRSGSTWRFHSLGRVF